MKTAGRSAAMPPARPGMGKSFALRCFAKSLNPNLYHMEYICLSTISVAEFYKQFCAILGVSDKGGKPGMFKAIQEQVYGGSRNIMETAALAAIHSHSQGNPRMADNLMTDALALGAQMDKKVITPEVILAAVGNQNQELIISGRGSMLTVILTKSSRNSSLSLWLRSQ